jgi:hypothetical protein
MFTMLLQKRLVQKVVIEIVADSIMMVTGLIIGYYIKIVLF